MSMDFTVGTAQTSKAITTAGITGAQAQPIARWLSGPIAAQTIAAQEIDCHFGFSEANLNSNFFPAFTVAVWRPSTGLVVGRLLDLIANNLGSFASTSEGACVLQQAVSTAVTGQDNDIIALEVWRDATGQGMATAYTNTIFYDGTTDDSITSNAAFLFFTNTVTMSGGAAAVIPDVNMAPMIGG